MLFYYKRTRKRQALTLAFNILILPVLLYVFSLIAKDQSNYEEMYAVAEKIFISIGAVLFSVMIWFLRSKKKFELYVTEDEFHSEHPFFKGWCFTVNPKDIKKIEHILNLGSRTININMTMNNGEWYQICLNYAYSRKNLYEALKKANPLIEFPENISGFKVSKEARKEMDKYVSKQFPIMTKFFKWLLRKKTNN